METRSKNCARETYYYNFQIGNEALMDSLLLKILYSSYMLYKEKKECIVNTIKIAPKQCQDYNETS
jgi:hypothetical protein